MIKLILTGRPITKKNHQEIYINTRTGKRFPRQSAAYRQYEESCLWQLKRYRGEMITGPVWVKALYYMDSRRSWPDMLGLMEATADILEKGRIIANDKFIESWDGTRIMGVDKGNPRVEIEVRGIKPCKNPNGN
jgi:Holliday junction resolvase RusA-like endonuclease